ncbi:MAG: SRPBCC family protein [Gemmatimonadales bacterium]
MGPVSFTYSGVVQVPIDRVFDLISDPLRMPEWLPRCIAVKPSAPERQGKGARYTVTFQRDAIRHESVIEIIEYSPPHGFGWVEIYHRVGSKTFFGLGFAGGSTKVTMKHIWRPTGLRSWLNGQFYRRRNAHRMFEGLINNLRKALIR